MNATKAAATVKNTKLYGEVRDLNIVAREFKVRKHCYHEFTHGFTSGVASIKKDSTPQNSPHPLIYEKDDFDKVKKFINNHIIEEGKYISMKVLH